MKSSEGSLTIKKVADQAGVGIETIRFYERKGLINKPERTLSGYRIFSKKDAKQVRFIKRAQELGFSLAEIKELLSLKKSTLTVRNDVYKKTHQKVQIISEKIASLQKIKFTLEQLLECCKGEGDIRECPILEAFEDDAKSKEFYS